jgi:hypothetical protein
MFAVYYRPIGCGDFSIKPIGLFNSLGNAERAARDCGLKLEGLNCTGKDFQVQFWTDYADALGYMKWSYCDVPELEPKFRFYIHKIEPKD